MGRRRQAKKQDKHQPGEQALAQGFTSGEHKPDPLIRIISLHPNKDVVAVAVGQHIRVVDFSAGSQRSLLPEPDWQPDFGGSIRFLEFNGDGSQLAAGGDDKSVRLWDTATWQSLGTWKAPKRVCAGKWTKDSKYILFADKYGDILCSSPSQADQPPTLLLGHLCSIVASLEVSPDNRFVVTTDKDRKARISVMPAPAAMQHGSVEIQSYCLGHRHFVNTSTFVVKGGVASGGTALLVTGSGDGTVRLWDHETGKQLDLFVAAEEQAAPQPAAGKEQTQEGGADGEEEEGNDGDEEGEEEEGAEGEGGEGDDEDNMMTTRPNCAAVLCVSASHDSRLVAVVVEGKDEALLLSVDWEARKLSLAQRVDTAAMGVRCPCQALFDRAGRLWVAGGPPVDTSSSAHIGVAVAGPSGEYAACSEQLLPSNVRKILECRNAQEEEQIASGALQHKLTHHLQLQRSRPYTMAELQERKRQRNDAKEAVRLAGGSDAA